LKTRTTFFGLLIVALIALAISPAIASAQTSTAHFSGKAAVAEWTVTTDSGPVTIQAILSLPSKGINELTISVTHPGMGTMTKTVTDFSYKWSMNHASTDSIFKIGPFSHVIKIEWTAISVPLVVHYRGIDPLFNEYAVINQPISLAIAQITIYDGFGIHPGTYSSDIAAIANIIENVK
jgi:hypothetical protein